MRHSALYLQSCARRCVRAEMGRGSKGTGRFRALTRVTHKARDTALPRNIERRYLHPTSRARAKVVVQSALYARKVRLVRHWALCIGQREVEGRVAGQLQGLPKLVEL